MIKFAIGWFSVFGFAFYGLFLMYLLAVVYVAVLAAIVAIKRRLYKRELGL